MIIGLLILLLVVYGIYRLIVWGTSDAPTEQESHFNPILGTTERSFFDNERGIIGPSDEDIAKANRAEQD